MISVPIAICRRCYKCTHPSHQGKIGYASNHKSNKHSYIEEDWYHPRFKSMRDAFIAMVNNANSEGTYLVTNVPDAERSYGLCNKDSYVVLRRGARCRDISCSVILYDENGGGFMISGTNQAFPSVSELIQYFQQNPLPNSDNTLGNPLLMCNRCTKCNLRKTINI